MTAVNEQRKTQLLAPDKTCKNLSAKSSVAIYLLSVLLIFSLSLILVTKTIFYLFDSTESEPKNVI